MPHRLGILGGTFDPVHLGHLRIAEEALDLLGLDEMLFIPASVPPHKTDRMILPFEKRWSMLELAIADNPRFRISDIERQMPGKSYTVRLLRKLHQEIPGSELFFLVGCDAFLEMNSWYRFTEIFRMARIVVLCRPGSREEDILEFLKKEVSGSYETVPQSGEIRHPEFCSVHSLCNTRMEVSSTRIRDLAADGLSVRYLVPDSVWGYIAKNKLYRGKP